MLARSAIIEDDVAPGMGVGSVLPTPDLTPKPPFSVLTYARPGESAMSIRMGYDGALFIHAALSAPATGPASVYVVVVPSQPHFCCTGRKLSGFKFL